MSIWLLVLGWGLLSVLTVGALALVLRGRARFNPVASQPEGVPAKRADAGDDVA